MGSNTHRYPDPYQFIDKNIHCFMLPYIHDKQIGAIRVREYEKVDEYGL